MNCPAGRNRCRLIPLAIRQRDILLDRLITGLAEIDTKMMELQRLMLLYNFKHAAQERRELLEQLEDVSHDLCVEEEEELEPIEPER